MIVTLGIAVTIDTDALEQVERERFGREAEFAGFPINDENIAWYLAEEIAENARLYGQTYKNAVRAEVDA